MAVVASDITVAEPSRSAILSRSIVWVLAGLLLTTSGCSRMFWRTQADFDAYNVLLQKTQDPRWDLPRVTVEADPRSRFYDPYNLDIAPLPPDDEAANRYMHWVDCMAGYKSWHKFGTMFSVENPHWLANYGFAPELVQTDWERPELVVAAAEQVAQGETPDPLNTGREVPTLHGLTLEQAIELANINSREYQTQIENVFLSALTLTFDQFQFNIRYLGLTGAEPTDSLTYFNTPSVRDDLQFQKRFGIRQALPTGGQWAVELANNTLWMFSGGNTTNSASVLSYSLTQPLLLGAGRKVALENLTLSERAVLYDVRQLARFRKIFFSNIVANGRGGGNIGVGAAGNSTGYLGLLQRLQQVINQQDNIDQSEVQIERLRQLNSQPPEEECDLIPGGLNIPPELASRLRYSVRRVRDMDDPRGEREVGVLIWREAMTEADFEQAMSLSDNPSYRAAMSKLAKRLQAGVVTLDLAQLLTRFSGQQTQLRDSERTYLDSVDQYKLLLGLPLDFQLSIDKSLLKQFELIDPQLKVVERSLLGFQQVLSRIDAFDPAVADLKTALEGIDQQRELVENGPLALVARDFERVDANFSERMQKLATDYDRQVARQDLERSRLVYNFLLGGRERILEQIADARMALAQEEVSEDDRRRIFRDIANTREDLLQTTQSLKAVQVGLRSELIAVRDFSMTQEEAVEIAMQNRLDLMNERANVMDARRQMEVAANRLEAVLNLVARGDIGTSGGNKPFDFRGDRSTFQAGVQFTAPLDQVLERNAYRTAQITYQQARRRYMEIEDQIKFDIRGEWRALQGQRLNFETARQNLRIAALQLDSAVETFNQPAQVGQSATANRNQNQGLNLINALNSVLQAQNQLIQIWVNYEQNRINIHRDMDIMQVDERGIWIDPIYQGSGSAPRSTPTYDEPAHDDLRPSAASGDGLPSVGARAEREEIRSAAFETEPADDRTGDAGRGDRRRLRVAEAAQPVVGTVDGVPARRWSSQSTPGRSRVGDGQAGDLPDHGDGAWHARQLEERGSGE